MYVVIKLNLVFRDKDKINYIYIDTYNYLSTVQYILHF